MPNEEIDFDSIKIFDDYSFADLAKEIHSNRKDIDETISDLITTTSEKLNTIQDFMFLSPVLKDFLASAVRNDENLVKLAGIIQRTMMRSNKGADQTVSLLTEDDKVELKNIYKENEVNINKLKDEK